MLEDDLLLEKLLNHKTRFLVLRKQLGLGDNVGFASLPLAHPQYTPGLLIKMFTSSQGVIKYVKNEYKHFYEKPSFTYLPKEDGNRIIISPNTNKPRCSVVSVYQKKGLCEGEIFDARILSLSDKALDGLIVHELTHELINSMKVPVEIQELLDKRQQQMHSFLVMQFLTGEPEVDIIAGLLGFKEETLELHDYLINCLKDSKEQETHEYLTTPKRMIERLNLRKTEVLNWC